jgi:hypothetical protein
VDGKFLLRRVFRTVGRQARDVPGKFLRDQLRSGRGLWAHVISVESEIARRLGVRFEVLGRSGPPSHMTPLRQPEDLAGHATPEDLSYPPNASGAFGLITLPLARVCMPSAVHAAGGWFIEEALMSPHSFAHPRYWWTAQIAKRGMAVKARRLPRGVLGTVEQHENFYHWLIEILPRLRMVEEGQVDRSLPIYMPERSAAFVKQSLNLVGLSHRVRWLPDGVYEAEGLIVPSRISLMCYPTGVALNWLRERLLESANQRAGGTPSSRPYLYVSRRDAKKRVPINDQEVASAMSSLGFEVVNFSEMDLAAQIRLASRARLMVGPHGAGFSHVAFLAEGAGIVELLEEGQGWVGGGYHYLASLRNVQYGLMLCGHGFVVDIPRLIRFVRGMLEAVEGAQSAIYPEAKTGSSRAACPHR